MYNMISVVTLLLICAICQAHGAVNCTETGAGRFAVPEDTTCRNYTFCVSTGTSFLSYDYTCPISSVFNPNAGQCTASSNYVCNVTTSTIDSTNATPPVCTAESFAANPDSTDCTSYIQCVNISDTFNQILYTCPNDTYFNPNTTLCEFDYICSTPSTCTSAGRFSDSTDNTCQGYHMCVLARDGTYMDYQYTCPNSTVFSPTAKLCTTSYTCTIT